MSKIYLISPPKINLDDFSNRLDLILKTGLVSVFQLRLKEISESEFKNSALKLKEICDKYNCPLIINDNYKLAIEIGAAGVHIGFDDSKVSDIRKNSPQNFIIGVSCYDSRHLAMEAAENGADYISFGAFFETKTKKSKGNPTVEILKWASEMLNLPIVAIGGINDKNCKTLVESGADFISVISYIWDNKDNEILALEKLNFEIRNIAK